MFQTPTQTSNTNPNTNLNTNPNPNPTPTPTPNPAQTQPQPLIQPQPQIGTKTLNPIPTFLFSVNLKYDNSWDIFHWYKVKYSKKKSIIKILNPERKIQNSENPKEFFLIFRIFLTFIFQDLE